MPRGRTLLPVHEIATTIVVIRGHRVILDADLARLYGVETKALNRAVKRNIERFPGDFLFQLTSEETMRLRYQIGTSTPHARGGGRYLPHLLPDHLPRPPLLEPAESLRVHQQQPLPPHDRLRHHLPGIAYHLVDEIGLQSCLERRQIRSHDPAVGAEAMTPQARQLVLEELLRLVHRVGQQRFWLE